MFRIRAVPLLLGFGLLAAACSGVPQPGASPTTAEQGGPKLGGNLSFPITAEPYDWDPLTFAKQGSEGGLGFAANTLVAARMGPDVPFNQSVLNPALAERWEVSADATAFTFHLRRGVRFANLPPVGGRELTASDVKFSLEYYGRVGEFKEKGPSSVSDYVAGLDRVEAPDPFTVVVRFKEPSVPFLSYSAGELLSILPREIYDQDGHFKDRIVGSGPYQLDPAASQKGTRWVWKKNKDYWEPGKPYLDEVRWLVIASEASELAAFQTKQIDYLGYKTNKIGYNRAQEIQRASPEAKYGEYEPSVSFSVSLNNRVKPLNDIRVRRALSMSLDRDEMIRTLQGGRGGWEMPGIFAGFFSQEEVRQLQPFNPTEAGRLVAEAGYPQGADIELMYNDTAGSEYISFLQLVQAQLKRGNFNVAMKALDNASTTRLVRQGNYHLRINQGGSTGSYRYDPDVRLATFHPKSTYNFWGIDDPQLTSLIEAQRREADPDKRREVVRQAGKRIIENAYMPGLYSALEYSFWHPYVKDVYRNSNGPRLPITSIWLDK